MYCIHLIFSEANGMEFYLNLNVLIKLKWQRWIIFSKHTYSFSGLSGLRNIYCIIIIPNSWSFNTREVIKNIYLSEKIDLLFLINNYCIIIYLLYLAFRRTGSIFFIEFLDTSNKCIKTLFIKFMTPI